MSSDDDARPYGGAPERRIYARPRPGESDEDFTNRFRDGFMALIADYRREHPEAQDVSRDASDDPAIARGQERLKKLREKRDTGE